jgi:hypothetical protein
MPFIALNDADTAVASTSRSQANLLAIPQELRDKIFEYVYGVSDAANKRINIRLPRLAWNIVDPAKAEARIPSYQAPPSKNAILVCRQLHMEMNNMQATALCRYWDESTFHVRDDVALSDRFCAGSDRDIQHVKHFVFHVRCMHEMVEVDLHFRTGKWAASFYISDRLWSVSVMFQQFGLPTPQALQPGTGFEEDMRRRSRSGAFSGERETMNPERGMGFTAEDLCVAKFVIDEAIDDWVFL